MKESQTSCVKKLVRYRLSWRPRLCLDMLGIANLSMFSAKDVDVEIDNGIS